MSEAFADTASLLGTLLADVPFDIAESPSDGAFLMVVTAVGFSAAIPPLVAEVFATPLLPLGFDRDIGKMPMPPFASVLLLPETVGLPIPKLLPVSVEGFVLAFGV